MTLAAKNVIMYLLAAQKNKKIGDNMKERKLGRPKKNNNKNAERITVRLEDTEKKYLEFCVEKTNLSKAEIFRRGLLLFYNQINHD